MIPSSAFWLSLVGVLGWWYTLSKVLCSISFRFCSGEIAYFTGVCRCRRGKVYFIIYKTEVENNGGTQMSELGFKLKYGCLNWDFN